MSGWRSGQSQWGGGGGGEGPEELRISTNVIVISENVGFNLFCFFKFTDEILS